jgi:hypothetical protein
MDLAQIINQLNLTVLTDVKDFSSITPSGGYTSDLLSCVMAGAPHQGVWVTLQAHSNIIAVAVLLELSAVIITEAAMPEPGVIAKANQEGITLLSSEQSSFYIVGKLWESGVRVV